MKPFQHEVYLYHHRLLTIGLICTIVAGTIREGEFLTANYLYIAMIINTWVFLWSRRKSLSSKDNSRA